MHSALNTARTLARTIVRIQAEYHANPLPDKGSRLMQLGLVANRLVQEGRISRHIVEPACVMLQYAPGITKTWADQHHHINWTSPNWSHLQRYWEQ